MLERPRCCRRRLSSASTSTLPTRTALRQRPLAGTGRQPRHLMRAASAIPTEAIAALRRRLDHAAERLRTATNCATRQARRWVMGLPGDRLLQLAPATADGSRAGHGTRKTSQALRGRLVLVRRVGFFVPIRGRTPSSCDPSAKPVPAPTLRTSSSSLRRSPISYSDTLEELPLAGGAIADTAANVSKGGAIRRPNPASELARIDDLLSH